jgi:Pyruvate/2-oxoglutarate dehydrogenase complex, dihydrolipoamide dehydrogenase (E3) component, and related enzymes
MTAVMKTYDLIVIGTGSAMNVVDAMLRSRPNMKIAVIDKDEPGGICLTRGCIPSKILLYPAELVRLIEKGRELGVSCNEIRVDFRAIMERMRSLIGKDISQIKYALENSENIDYYRDIAEFVAPYTIKVAGEVITSKTIFLCTGSKPIIPRIEGIEKIGYLTSDTILALNDLPKSIAIVGGGYIAAEYGHFLSSMGSQVTIIGRNAQFLHDEEPEIARVVQRELGKHIKIITNHEVTKAELNGSKKLLTAKDRSNGNTISIEADEILIAAGRGPLNDILHPERAKIETDSEGWIKVNEYLETSQPGIWAIGDADGRYLFKHVANYESEVLYYNAVLKRRVKVDYRAVPHAVFTHPEVAAVGMKEAEAISRYGKENILIGYYKYEDTAKGEAMAAKDYFVKIIVKADDYTILGAHIVGNDASVLIHDIIVAMYSHEGSIMPIMDSMFIHPALNEVVQRAAGNLRTVDEYHNSISL